MTAGSPMTVRQPSRPVGARAIRPEPAPLRASPPKLVPVAAADDEEFRINLDDLPRQSQSLHVDGFAPSLASRVLDLLDRIRGR